MLDHNALKNQMSREAFYTSILTLKIGSKSQQVVVKGVERHPARPHDHAPRLPARPRGRRDHAVRPDPLPRRGRGQGRQGPRRRRRALADRRRSPLLAALLAGVPRARRHEPRAESDLPPLGHQGCPRASRSSRSPAATTIRSSRSTRRAPRKSTSRSRPRRRPAKCPRWRRPSPGPKAKPAPATRRQMPRPKPNAKAGRQSRRQEEGVAGSFHLSRLERPPPRRPFRFQECTSTHRNGNANRLDRRPRQSRARVRSHPPQRRVLVRRPARARAWRRASRASASCTAKPPRSRSRANASVC